MANNKALEIWSGLPTWAKGVIAVGGIAIIYFTSKSIVKSIGRKVAKDSGVKAIKDTKDEIRDNIQSGKKQSYPDSQYKGWADTLQKAFDGCDPFETVQNTVNRIVKELKNDTDWLKLVDAYGVRTHDQCGWFMGDFSGNLYAALYDDLDSTEVNNVNKLLAERGITYRIG